MSRKKKLLDGLYSREFPSFWFDDERIQSLAPLDRLFFFYICLMGIKERREVLPSYITPARIAHLCGLDARCVTKRVTNLLHKCLIDQTPDGRLIICGIKSRHENMEFKDDELGTDKVPQKDPIILNDIKVNKENINIKNIKREFSYENLEELGKGIEGKLNGRKD